MSRTFRDRKRRDDHHAGLAGWGANFAWWPAYYIPRYGYPNRGAVAKSSKSRRPVATKRKRLLDVWNKLRIDVDGA